MTYKQIQEEYRRLYGKTIKSCWIADVKRELGLPIRMAYNRENDDSIKNWCKDKIVRERIKNIIKIDKSKLKA
jgi:hypothetical protein